MPSDTYGFTGTEIVTLVKNYIGNSATDFQTFVEQILPLAEFRFCKAFNWKFLKKRNRSLTVSSGTSEYTLNSAGIGYYMQADEVENIFCPGSGIYLKKTSLEAIRRGDPEINDGNASSAHITHWAPVGDNEIIVYPPTFADTTLKVDGKITPGALSTLSNYPTVPYRYQESFICYVMSLALDRENDDRAPAKKAEAMALIKQDIADDSRALGGTPTDRFMHPNEVASDGSSSNLEQLYDRMTWNSV